MTTVPAMSALKTRWLLAIGCLSQEAKRTGITPSFDETSGIIHRCLARAKKRGKAISGEEIITCLEKLWSGCAAGNPTIARHLVLEIEFVLARSPRTLLHYLRLAKGAEWQPLERQALLHFSLAWCESGNVRQEVNDQLISVLANFVSASAVEPAADQNYIPTSQRVVHDELLMRGELFFGPKLQPLRIQPRLTPLVVGPTGAGKTHIIESMGKKLGAKFLKISFGDWVPTGANEACSTMKMIFRQIQAHERVVLLLDELCKYRSDYAGGWVRSVASDLWQLLDRSPGNVDYEESALLGCDWKKLMNERLFIVGAGTWQHIQKIPPVMGFAPASVGTIQDRIHADGLVPEEILMRFNPRLLVLRYPLQSETEEIFDRSGITMLAKAAGETLHPESHDWNNGGMRSLEDLTTTLLLKIHQQKKGLN